MIDLGWAAHLVIAELGHRDLVWLPAFRAISRDSNRIIGITHSTTVRAV